MSTILRTFKDKLGNIIAPRTVSTAVQMPDGYTLDDKLVDINDQLVDIEGQLGPIAEVNQTTVFNADGSITVTKADGTVINTVFNADGSIAETTTKDGVSKTKTTVFNADGSISETFS